MNNRSRMFTLLFVLSVLASSLPANSKEYMFRLTVKNPWYSGVLAKLWLFWRYDTDQYYLLKENFLIGQSRTFPISDPDARFTFGTYWYVSGHYSGFRCWEMQALPNRTSGSIIGLTH